MIGRVCMRKLLKHHNFPDLWHRVYRMSSVILSSSINHWTLIYFHFNRVCVLFVTATIVTSPLEGWELKMNSQEKENRKKSVDCSTPAQGSPCSSNVLQRCLKNLIIWGRGCSYCVNVHRYTESVLSIRQKADSRFCVCLFPWFLSSTSL